MDILEYKSKSIHEIENYIKNVIALQIKGKDVAIPYLQGAPGCGKTAMINSWANKYDWNVFSVHFALMPIEEISGIPIIKDIIMNNKEYKGTEWTMPGIISKLYEMDQSKITVLFLDDFHLCSPDHLNLGFELFTNRSIHGYKIPDNTAFILAGNNSTKAGSKISNSAIINRCSINPVNMDFDFWKKFYAIPAEVNHKIISFLSSEKYKKYFHMEEMVNKPWASPRSWTRLSEILQSFDSNISFQDLIYFSEAHVGSEAGVEFTAFWKLYSETQMELIFDKKKEISIPDDMSGQYIYVMSAVGEFFRRSETQNEAIDVISDIFIEISKKNVSIATVGFKELVESISFGIYQKIKDMIEKKDFEVSEKINKEITLI